MWGVSRGLTWQILVTSSCTTSYPHQHARVRLLHALPRPMMSGPPRPAATRTALVAVSLVGFICKSLVTSEVGHLFMCC